ncbi:hypothetical protein D1BOALGB6SA_4156 [Olavius sp. associated proteobacterium Delta 1]|nr:hypothetical protein D1BOALGB6SA_4156 [Olavius sp. associated proteobacterium Delta 1]
MNISFKHSDLTFARILGVNRGTVWNRIRKYGIDIRRHLFS